MMQTFFSVSLYFVQNGSHVVCVCVYIYIYTHTHTHTHIYIHTTYDPSLYIYRVIQEESAILWEMIVCVILSKKVHMNMGPILNGYGVMTA